MWFSRDSKNNTQYCMGLSRFYLIVQFCTHTPCQKPCWLWLESTVKTPRQCWVFKSGETPFYYIQTTVCVKMGINWFDPGKVTVKGNNFSDTCTPPLIQVSQDLSYASHCKSESHYKNSQPVQSLELFCTVSDANWCSNNMKSNSSLILDLYDKQQQQFVVAKNSIGIKFTVFPDPVWAQAITSLPAKMAGMAYFCTGVGLVYPAFLTFSWYVSYSWAWWKPWIGMIASLPLPVTSTGISSYLSKLIPRSMERNNSSSFSEGVGGTYVTGAGRSTKKITTLNSHSFRRSI